MLFIAPPATNCTALPKQHAFWMPYMAVTPLMAEELQGMRWMAATREAVNLEGALTLSVRPCAAGLLKPGPSAGLELPADGKGSSQRFNLPTRLLTLDVRRTPLGSGTDWAAPPVSCPSRLQHTSPQRHSSSRFDPFAALDDALPGCTPLCAQQAGQAAAPPAVHRKPTADGSPAQVPRAAAAALAADRVQSCPPERVGRRGSRPLVRVRCVLAGVACDASCLDDATSCFTRLPSPHGARRVKRSLNGAVAAAAGPPIMRRSLDTPGGILGLPAQQLAGCSRKRFEAELVSPPMPRKSSRTLLDEQQAAEMFTQLQLAPQQASGGCSATALSP